MEEEIKPPNVTLEKRIPVSRFERLEGSAAMSFLEGDELWRLPPGGYVVYKADEPND